MKKTKFDVQGMTCSSCVAHVENAVCKLKGTKKVNVNLLSNSMMVEYDEKSLSEQQIISAVKDSGYLANISNITKEKRQKNVTDSTEQMIKNLRKRLII